MLGLLLISSRIKFYRPFRKDIKVYRRHPPPSWIWIRFHRPSFILIWFMVDTSSASLNTRKLRQLNNSLSVVYLVNLQWRSTSAMSPCPYFGNIWSWNSSLTLTYSSWSSPVRHPQSPRSKPGPYCTILQWSMIAVSRAEHFSIENMIKTEMCVYSSIVRHCGVFYCCINGFINVSGIN